MATGVQTCALPIWLRDRRAKARITSRIDRLAQGHWGDVEPVGEGVKELRIFYGKGYRVYVKKRGQELVVLLYGGHKGTQQKDIDYAIRLAKELEE